MRTRFLLGPAGSGKTHLCQQEIRAALLAAPDGPPLVLLAPKQMTYQLERQLLADDCLAGYTRLQVLSFERLAFWVRDQLGEPEPRLLDAEGRIMVLRALLARKRSQLQLFRASARLTGFAQELSHALAELQTHQVTPVQLRAIAARLGEASGIAAKLLDFALLLEEYLAWLNARGLQDAQNLFDAAAAVLRRAPAEPRIAGLWVDGFAEFTPQETALLAALAAHCAETTVTFCLDREPREPMSWLSPWAVVRQSFERCRAALSQVATRQIEVETITRQPDQGRFNASPILQHLESFWAEPKPFSGSRRGASAERRHALASESPGLCSDAALPEVPGNHLRVVECASAEAEAVFAARQILRFVRAGGRFRDVTVLVRDLEAYHAVLGRVFTRYQIPCFMDRRESVAHHPLAELTRSALRTVARDWQHEDWFAALKSGLVSEPEDLIDRLENAALAHGWRGGATWLEPLSLPGDPVRAESFARLRKRLVPPFQRLATRLGGRLGKPSGAGLAAGLRELWRMLEAGSQLETWALATVSGTGGAAGLVDHPAAVHHTVWEQMNGWLENLERAFADEKLPLAEWLPILDAGLGSLTVGVIPPALDQVRLGAVNRSRNPDVRLAFVLGLNEGTFPARPTAGPLLSDSELATLAEHGVALSSLPLRQIGREHHFGYVACTRARRQLILTTARADGEGKPLNPSPFLERLKTLFPKLEVEASLGRAAVPPAVAPSPETAPVEPDASADSTLLRLGPPRADSEPLHVHELIPQLLVLPAWPWACAPSGHSMVCPDSGAETSACGAHWETCFTMPEHASGSGSSASTPVLADFHLRLLASLAHLRGYADSLAQDRLSPGLADKLHGPVLLTSVSRLEQFAACPFKFFVYAGLRAEERVRFELDVREQGSFQHEVLAAFHDQLCREHKRWRDVTPAEARARIERLGRALAVGFREGLFSVNAQARFKARMLTGALQDFIEVLVGWMRGQYDFDPAAVELAFGEASGAPAWQLDLGEGRRLALRGRIDRVDLSRDASGDDALCVVVDYKSSQRDLDPVLLANGVQLQLPAYLNVLQAWREPHATFGVGRLRPAGVFYVSLRGAYARQTNRTDALTDADEARRLAFQHAGRFDASALGKLDNRGAARGDQFNYRRKQDGELMKNCREALSPEQFITLLRSTEENLKRMGREIFSGAARVDPYRHKQTLACDQCSYQAICRIDPWTHPYRLLRMPEGEAPAEAALEERR